MRKMFWTAAVLVLAAAPVSAQQAEKTSFAPAAVEAAPAVQPQAEAKEKAPSVHVSRQQLDEADVDDSADGTGALSAMSPGGPKS